VRVSGRVVYLGGLVLARSLNSMFPASNSHCVWFASTHAHEKADVPRARASVLLVKRTGERAERGRGGGGGEEGGGRGGEAGGGGGGGGCAFQDPRRAGFQAALDNVCVATFPPNFRRARRIIFFVSPPPSGPLRPRFYCPHPHPRPRIGPGISFHGRGRDLLLGDLCKSRSRFPDPPRG